MKRIIDVKLELWEAFKAYRNQNPLSAHNGEALVDFMYDRVTYLRGDQLVTRNEIEKAEDKALGRADYDAKFALYCAELVLESR